LGFPEFPGRFAQPVKPENIMSLDVSGKLGKAQKRLGFDQLQRKLL
jgi:hypothetical protein